MDNLVILAFMELGAIAFTVGALKMLARFQKHIADVGRSRFTVVSRTLYAWTPKGP